MVIYFIFSHEAFEEEKASFIENSAFVWVNPDFFTQEQLAELKQAGLNIHCFEQQVNGSNDKSIISALEPIEKQFPDAEILVEYL